VFTKTKVTGAIISSMLYSPRLPMNYSVDELKNYLRNQGINVKS
jgi:imidazole glycerol phosphate synthase subunit HisF